MKVIITGASGFVGQNLSCYLLNRNVETLSLSLRNTAWKDTVDKDATALIHLAGKAHDISNHSDKEAYLSINRDLTIAVFDEFLNSNIQDFFYFSSVKAVADSVVGTLYESSERMPQTAYGMSKLQAEEYLLSKSLPKSKRLFIIRPCMIHGPGNKGNLNLLYSIVSKGFPWPLASFENERSFLSIDNLTFLISQMLVNSKIESGIYNFADDDSLSTNQLVSIISATLGRKNKLWRIPPSFIKTLVKIGDYIPIPLNSERLKKLTESYVVSNTKIKQSLGLKHLPVSASEGLIKTIESFKKSN